MSGVNGISSNSDYAPPVDSGASYNFADMASASGFYYLALASSLTPLPDTESFDDALKQALLQQIDKTTDLAQRQELIQNLQTLFGSSQDKDIINWLNSLNVSCRQQIDQLYDKLAAQLQDDLNKISTDSQNSIDAHPFPWSGDSSLDSIVAKRQDLEKKITDILQNPQNKAQAFDSLMEYASQLTGVVKQEQDYYNNTWLGKCATANAKLGPQDSDDSDKGMLDPDGNYVGDNSGGSWVYSLLGGIESFFNGQGLGWLPGTPSAIMNDGIDFINDLNVQFAADQGLNQTLQVNDHTSINNLTAKIQKDTQNDQNYANNLKNTTDNVAKLLAQLQI